MPFKSKAQQGFMFSKHPEIAKKWAAETNNFKSLPKKVSKKESTYKAMVKGKKDV